MPLDRQRGVRCEGCNTLSPSDLLRTEFCEVCKPMHNETCGSEAGAASGSENTPAPAGPVTTTDAAKLKEIARLHDEAFWAAMAADGVCKSSEGQLGVEFTNAFERRDGTPTLTINSVSVWAYVVGPSRDHVFDSVDEALEAVRNWHRNTMRWVKEQSA